MKFIARANFANPPGLPIKPSSEGEQHPKTADGKGEHKIMVPKGAIFEIGTASNFADLSAPEQQLVAHLRTPIKHGKILEATDANLKKIKDEVANEKKVAAARPKVKSLEQLVADGISAALPGIVSAVASAMADPKAALKAASASA